MNGTVLFVDDDEANLAVCEAVCGDTFAVLTAPSAGAALQLMSEHEVAVIISDQRMPGMSGAELLAKVRQDYPRTVRLLITAYSDTRAAVDAINRGQVRRYLKKPWEPEELKTEIRQALEWHHTQDRLAQIERRLTQTERVYALGIVAASIGHELRNPMSWITGNLDHSSGILEELQRLAQTQPVDVTTLSKKLDRLGAAMADAKLGAARVCEIIAGIQASMVQPATLRGPVDLGEVLRLALRLGRGELARSARLDVDVRGNAKVYGSRTQLSQIILNLIVNAAQSVSAQVEGERVIAARLVVDGTVATVEIADSGAGVPKPDRESIFDPFFTTKPGVGTGLGLAISRRIAEELGGKLDVSDDSKLGGALFRLSLPCVCLDSDTASPPGAA
jgi:signal transduction histidine kinase